MSQPAADRNLLFGMLATGAFEIMAIVIKSMAEKSGAEKQIRIHFFARDFSAIESAKSQAYKNNLIISRRPCPIQRIPR